MMAYKFTIINNMNLKIKMKREDELPDYELKKVLHEPLAPYVSSAYNILINLVQGFVLASIFYVIRIPEQWPPIVVCNLIICFGLVIVIWYNYITNSQYHVIRITIFDVIIPIVLGVCQCALALNINQPIYIFTLLVIPIFIMIEFTHLNGYIKNNDPLALGIFKEHYEILGLQFAQDIYDEFIRFHIFHLKKTFLAIIILCFLTLSNYFPLNLELQTYISLIVIGIFIITGTYFDLNNFFNNSEKLKKYGYKW